MSEQIKSPCIQVCKYDEQGICTGCYRTMEDITRWLFMTDEQKIRALKAAKLRRETPKSGKQDYDRYV